ncbi:hypothetical protein CGRA01v4_10533 [Colletotrichum graminicola]|nr:hypothetical protein CGRA01v4_10533 [Colletotrichum graminicola]
MTRRHLQIKWGNLDEHVPTLDAVKRAPISRLRIKATHQDSSPVSKSSARDPCLPAPSPRDDADAKAHSFLGAVSNDTRSHLVFLTAEALSRAWTGSGPS